MTIASRVLGGVTLIIATGNGLPNFPAAAGPALLNAPPAFGPDCGISSTTSMDCAAETAIVAYFERVGRRWSLPNINLRAMLA